MGERRGRMGRMPSKDAGRSGGRPRSDSGKSFKDRQKSGFRRDSGRFSDRKPGKSRRDDRGSGRLEMHKIICDKCGKESEVPFKPTSSKPIYCSDCFVKPEGSSRKSSSGASSEDIAMLNMKLDKIMHALKVK